jgi:hypothetical protein
MNQLLPHVEPLDEVGRHANIVEVLENVFGDPVVEDPLPSMTSCFFALKAVASSEVLDQRSRFRSFIGPSLPS